jgi:hypothetical protein
LTIQRLMSCYFLGATPERLAAIYEQHSASEEKWIQSPGEITDDWPEFLGRPEYQRAFIDFFEDRFVGFAYDWNAMVRHFLFEGEQPLIHGLISGCECQRPPGPG